VVCDDRKDINRDRIGRNHHPGMANAMTATVGTLAGRGTAVGTELSCSIAALVVVAVLRSLCERLAWPCR
jgi:hypothetical protein